MKNSIRREILLLCAPVAIVVFAAGVAHCLQVTKTSPPVIALTLRQEHSHSSGLRLNWEATVTDGPKSDLKSGYRFGFRERVVAISGTSERVIYSASRLGAFGHDELGAVKSTKSLLRRGVQLGVWQIPPHTQRLEWRGEVIAMPVDNGPVNAPATAKSILSWSNLPGAARVEQVFPLQLVGAESDVCGR